MMDLLGGLFSLGSSLIGGLLGNEGTESANQQSAAMAREQMAFQERMSGSSYQRAVKDMQSAGLNPMSAYSQGGASTPGGASVKFDSQAAGALSGAAQAQGVVQGLQNVAKTAADTDNVKAVTDQVRSMTFEKDVNSALRYNELLNAQYTGNKIDSEARLSQQELVNRGVDESAKRLALSRDQSTFSADVAKRKYESQLTGLEIPRAKSDAEFNEKLGSAAPGLKWLVDLLRGVGQIRGGVR